MISDSVDDTHIYSSAAHASTINLGHSFALVRISRLLKANACILESPTVVYFPPAVKVLISVPRLRMRPTFKPDAGSPDPFTISYFESSTLLFMTLLHNFPFSLTRSRNFSKSFRLTHKTLPNLRVGLTRTIPQQPPRWRLYATTTGLHIDLSMLLDKYSLICFSRRIGRLDSSTKPLPPVAHPIRPFSRFHVRRLSPRLRSSHCRNPCSDEPTHRCRYPETLQST